MHDFSTFRREAIRYWEKRRIWYNVAMIPPAGGGYFFTTVLWAAVGDRQYLNSLDVLGLFTLGAVGANICYCFAYGMEFIFGDDNAESLWLRIGRPAVFVCGTLFAMSLAMLAGHNIGIIEYTNNSELN